VRSAYDASVEREQFNEMLARLPDLDVLLVYRLDRLTRRGARHLLELVEDRLTPNGVALVSATEPIDTTGPMGELLLTVLAVLAKLESTRLSDRAVAARAHMEKQGRFLGGPIPFGCRRLRNSDGSRLVAHEPEAAVLREACARVAAGEPYTTVARDFTERGLDRPRASRGPRWSESTLRTLILNPVLAGYQARDGVDLVFNDGEPVVIVDGPPAVDPALWQKARAVLEQRAGSRPTREGRSLLAGLVTCAACGRPMTLNRRHRAYTCRTRYVDGPEACPGNSVSQRGLEQEVLGFLDAHLATFLQRGSEQQAEQEAEAGDWFAERLGHLEILTR
jgi:site-specific DNA recombinase